MILAKCPNLCAGCSFEHVALRYEESGKRLRSVKSLLRGATLSHSKTTLRMGPVLILGVLTSCRFGRF